MPTCYITVYHRLNINIYAENFLLVIEGYVEVAQSTWLLLISWMIGPWVLRALDFFLLNLSPSGMYINGQ